MKKMDNPGRPVMKPLVELALLDHFLFACVMEDRGAMGSYQGEQTGN